MTVAREQGLGLKEQLLTFVLEYPQERRPESLCLVMLHCALSLMDGTGGAPYAHVMDQFEKSVALIKEHNEWPIHGFVHPMQSSGRMQAYGALRRPNLIRTQTHGVDTFFVLPDVLDRKSSEEIKSALKTKLKCLYPKTYQEPGSTNPAPRHVLSPMERLTRHIQREFQRKPLIGDISVNDEEYELLLEHLRSAFARLNISYSKEAVDPLLCVALVQLGIRCYDGGYWPYVKEALGIRTQSLEYQALLGNSFIATLHKYGKYCLGSDERVKAILMHAFVTDSYTDDFFDFLFYYYEKDLERDIERADIRELYEVIQSNSGAQRKRTYMLVHQTVDALAVHPNGSKIRLRRFLKLIDDCFWKQQFEVKGTSRLTQALNRWMQEGRKLEKSYRGMTEGERSAGKRAFTTPYIQYKGSGCVAFTLQMPAQIIRSPEDVPQDVHWKVTIGNLPPGRIDCEVIEVVTGYKTAESSVLLSPDMLFLPIHFDLMHGEETLRAFSFPQEDCRFFDKQLNCLPGKELPLGRVDAVTPAAYPLTSNALLDSDYLSQLHIYHLDLQEGDYVRLAGGKVLTVGGRLEEGMTRRGRLEGIRVAWDGEEYPVYRELPNLLVKMKESRFDGTSILVNKKPFRLADVSPMPIVLEDRSGETGFYISLENLGVAADGAYEIAVDVPNDRRLRQWRFAYIHQFDFHFESDEEQLPYLFENRGTVVFPESFALRAESEQVEKEEEGNIFDFTITWENAVLRFTCALLGEVVTLNVHVPALFWRFEGDENWHVDKPHQIWYTDLPPKIHFRCPAGKIVLGMEEDDGEEDEQEHEQTCVKSGQSDYFVCDMTRFKSWINRERVLYPVWIELNGNNSPKRFFSLVAKSVVSSSHLEGDFNRNVLVAMFQIIGKSDYFVDVFYGQRQLVSKQPLQNGRLEYAAQLQSGTYRLALFEAEADDAGFDEPVFYSLGDFTCELVDPYHLSGKYLELRALKIADTQAKGVGFYLLHRIRLIRHMDEGRYLGLMIKKDTNGAVRSLRQVQVYFPDLNDVRRCCVYYMEDGAECDFLFDLKRHELVIEEVEGLRKSDCYRRFPMLMPESEFSIVYLSAAEDQKDQRAAAYSYPQYQCLLEES